MLTNTTNVLRRAITSGPLATYDISFPYWDRNEIKVYLTLSTGSLVKLQMGVDYSLSEPNGNNGTLTRLSTWTSNATFITIQRELELTQTTDLRDGDVISADTLEESLDHITAKQQQLNEQISRSLTSPIDEIGDNLQIPRRAQRIGNGSGTIFGFNSTGDGVALRDLSQFDTDVANAANSASAALTAKTQAENAKAQAENSRQAAETAKIEAQTARDQVDEKKAEALSEISNAKTDATNAISSTKTDIIDEITSAKNSAKSEITTAQIRATEAVNGLSPDSARSRAISTIHEETDYAIRMVSGDGSTSAKTQAIASINQQRDSAIAAVNGDTDSARTRAVAQVEAKGQEIISSLPEDFNEVRSDIATVKGAIASSETRLIDVTDRLSTIESSVSSGYTYKGNCTYAQLPSSAQAGDMWFATDRGENYAYDGVRWNPVNSVGIAWVLGEDGDYRLGIRNMEE